MARFHLQCLVLHRQLLYPSCSQRLTGFGKRTDKTFWRLRSALDSSEIHHTLVIGSNRRLIAVLSNSYGPSFSVISRLVRIGFRPKLPFASRLSRRITRFPVSHPSKFRFPGYGKGRHRSGYIVLLRRRMPCRVRKRDLSGSFCYGIGLVYLGFLLAKGW